MFISVGPPLFNMSRTDPDAQGHSIKKIKVPTQAPPQKLRNFCLTPQKKRKDQRMPMDTTPQKWLFQTPSEILVHRGVCTLNGMARRTDLTWSLN
jgi:hypothetical protein